MVLANSSLQVPEVPNMLSRIGVSGGMFSAWIPYTGCNRKLPELFHPSDHYRLLIVHVGTNDTSRNNTDHMRGDNETLDKRVKEIGLQIVFSSILPVEDKGPHRDHGIMEVNT